MNMERLIFFILVTTLHLGLNYILIVWLKLPNIRHGLQQIARSLIWFYGAIHFANGDNWTLWATFVGFHLVFWFPFDTGLNLLRGLNWNYHGSTSWLDKKIPYDITPLKILLMIIGIALLISPNGY